MHLGCLKPLVRDTSGTQLWETTTLSQLSMTCPRGQVEQRRDATVLPEGAGTRRCAEPSAAGWREALGPPRKRQLLPLPLSQSTWGGALHPGSMPGAATTLSPGTSRASEGRRRVEGRGGEAHGLGARDLRGQESACELWGADGVPLAGALRRPPMSVFSFLQSARAGSLSSGSSCCREGDRDRTRDR